MNVRRNDEMTPSRGDVLFTVLCFVLIFYVKKQYFVSPDGISITFGEIDIYDSGMESYLYSSLWVSKKKIHLVQRSTKCYLQLLILMCGDIETCPGPIQYRDMDSFLKVKGFSLLHQNIRGLIGKKDLISNLLFTHHKIDILSLSETFLSSLENNTKIGGYTFESKNRDNGIGGGVGAYIRDGIPYTRREDLECKELELMWIEISFKNAKKFLLGVLY